VANGQLAGIRIAENGQRRQLLCDEHYMELMARIQGGLSPLDSLFYGGPLDGLSGDLWPQMESGRDSRSHRTLAPAASPPDGAMDRVTAGS